MDLNFVGDRVSLAPQGSAIVDLDQAVPPDLVIEVADSSLNDDLGKKRLLYEELNVAEYWVIDVENAQIIAFAIADNGSRRIHQSQVLPGLDLDVMREAIALSRQRDDSQLVAWMMTQFQES